MDVGPLKREQSQRGFTLLELLVVVAILGLLAATAIPIYQNAMNKSRRMALAADLNALHTAFMRYYADHGKFPSDMGGADSFDLTTLSPLSTGGYFEHVDTLLSRVQDNEILFYVALDVNGPDSNFVLATISLQEPDLWAYAVSLDWGGGLGAIGYEGVYFWDGETLMRPDEVN
jgi:prepilin-type N-terminal cleavage/methylation domain-containing protein